MRTQVLARPIGQYQIHDPKMKPQGGAIQFHQVHQAKPIDLDTHQPQALARKTYLGSPSTAHAAVIHGAAPIFTQHADGGSEKTQPRKQEKLAAASSTGAPATSTTTTAPTFSDSDLMRSGMELANIAPEKIEEALTYAYLLTTLSDRGITGLADQKILIEALDLKANIHNLASIQDVISNFDEHTIPFLLEAKALGSTKLYTALREMAAVGFNLPANRSDIVNIFNLIDDPSKVMDALAILIEFDLPINFVILKVAKDLGDISLYPLLKQLHTDGIDDPSVAQTLIADFKLSTDDLKTDSQPKYTEAMSYYKAFAGKAYNTDVVTEAKTWVIDESIQTTDIIGILVNFLDGKESADKNLIYGAFMVAFSNGDQNSLTAILDFGKTYSRATDDQRDTARDLLSGYSEGDYSSETSKARFVRLLQKQMP